MNVSLINSILNVFQKALNNRLIWSQIKDILAKTKLSSKLIMSLYIPVQICIGSRIARHFPSNRSLTTEFSSKASVLCAEVLRPYFWARLCLLVHHYCVIFISQSQKDRLFHMSKQKHLGSHLKFQNKIQPKFKTGHTLSLLYSPLLIFTILFFLKS